MPLWACTSRKTASVSLRSCVNLIVGCMWLSRSSMSSSCRSVFSHTTNMSSMNLFHRRGLIASSSRKRSSSFAMNRFANVGATRVPMATPKCCRYIWPPKTNTLSLSMCLSRVSVMYARFRSQPWCPSNMFVQVLMASSCGMFVYSDVTSIVTRMASRAKRVFSSMFTNSPESRM